MRVSFAGPVCVLALTAALASAPAGSRVVAAPPAGAADERELVDKVNRAISQGVQYLKINQKNGNNWEGFWLNAVGGMDGGVTALATLALLNCGEKPEAEQVKGALDYLRRQPRTSTYVVSLTTMVFAEARQPRDLPLIQQNIDWLLRNAVRPGGKIAGWSYHENPTFPPDASNTQYALLALYAGKQAGAKVSEADWQHLYDLYESGQKPLPDGTGYWEYMRGAQRQSFTMTVAGVSGLVIAGLGRGQSSQRLDPKTGVAANCGRYGKGGEVLARGLNYIGKNFRFDRPRGGESTYYNMYGIERVGRLSGQRFLGDHDWYREGCVYLTDGQRKDGGWSHAEEDGVSYDTVAAIATSFSLLFLSKGRTPILISKLAHGDLAAGEGGLFAERGPDPAVVDWNRKHNDIRHLTEFAGRELFKGLPMGWQVYDPRRRDLDRQQDLLAEVGVLVQSPVLYLNGHDAPRLTGQQKELFKRYVEEGGFVIAEACCGSEAFAAGYRALVKELFPDNQLRPVPPEHPLWRTYFAVKPTDFPKLECLDRGCRTVMVFSSEPLAGYWEEARFMPAPGSKAQVGRGGEAYRLAGNIIAYATGLEPPQQRLSSRKIADAGKADLSPPRGFLKPAQLKLTGEPAPAPAAMRNLMGHVRAAGRLDVVLQTESLGADNPELFKYKVLYMHGRKRFTLSEEELTNLRVTLQSGGLLLADAACGKPEFDAAFREMAAKLFPDSKLVPIPLDDELYSAGVNGKPLTTVKRREKASAAGADAGFADLPPALEGIKIDGRWAVIYSKYDLGCSLEGHKSTDCLGHDRDSALRVATAAVLYMLKK